jgi:tape measure domain-containing protein
MRSVTGSFEEAADAQERVYQIAQAVRSPLADVGELFARVVQSTQDLGVSQEDAAKLTETLGKAFQLNGNTIQEAKSSLYQFTQALRGGKLDGENFRRVLETSPELIDIFREKLAYLGKGSKLTGEELQKLAKDGQLTASRLLEALGGAFDLVGSKFQVMQRTFDNAFVTFGNAWSRWLGDINRATGAAEGFNTVLQYLARNLGDVAIAVGVVSAAVGVLLARQVASWVSGIIAGLTALTGGPTGAVVAALALVTAALFTFGNAWVVNSETGLTALDLLKAGILTIEIGRAHV